ncbi:hypothetical protein CBM2588_A120386 [Cupriavidus taiwanensis]|nr:hypothetical protein CBM2588_A120386 [Cupriavidus taiwanensis]SOZ54437.1 hypothetical protein CBM2617_A170218 [Cupriavidus taiwanensis]SOZ77928.1 hypothetical protein CBM2622_A150384 [Cupriavidus taiwanensis]
MPASAQVAQQRDLATDTRAACVEMFVGHRQRLLFALALQNVPLPVPWHASPSTRLLRHASILGRFLKRNS